MLSERYSLSVGEATALAAVAAANDGKGGDEDNTDGDADGNTNGDALGLAETLDDLVGQNAGLLLGGPVAREERFSVFGGLVALILGAALVEVVVPVEAIAGLACVGLNVDFGGVVTARSVLGKGLDNAERENGGDEFEHLNILF